MKKVLGLFSAAYKEPKTCEACGEEFVCGATLKGCWCMKVKLSDEVRDRLKSQFRDCLCGNCLEKFGST